MSDIINLNLKYSPKALIPSQLMDGKALGQKYKLYGGEVATFRILGTWTNVRGESEKALNKLCQSLYDIDFASFQSVWQRRIGRLDGYWHKIEMNLSE